MADTQKTGNSVNSSIADYIETMSLDNEGLLRSIDLTLKAIARKDGLIISQSSLQDLANIEKQMDQDGSKVRSRFNSDSTRTSNSSTSSARQRRYRQSQYDDLFNDNQSRRRTRVTANKLAEDMETGFRQALFGTRRPLEDSLEQIITSFAKGMDVSVNDLGNEFGRRIGDRLRNAAQSIRLGNTTLGDRWEAETRTIHSTINRFAQDSLSHISTWFTPDGSPIDFSDLDLFAEDRGQEAPQVRDIEDIANTHFDETNDILRRGFEAVVNAYTNSQNNAIDNDYSDVEDADFRDITDQVSQSGQNSDAVNQAADILGDVVNSNGELGNIINTNLPALAGETGSVGGSLPALAEGAEAAGGALPALAEGAGAAGGALPALAEGAGAIGGVAFPWLYAAVIAATFVFDALTDAIGPAIEGFQSFAGSLTNASNYDVNKARKIADEQKKRIEADQKSIVEAAYNVIKDSAKRIEQVWDDVFATVVTAQGYTKAGVQELWSGYAQRLKENSLASVISSADIMDKLQSVLEQGLSGAVAEEFAYQATILNAAIPTEDFFQYASTYASIAANAIKTGQSQEEAIQLANQELKDFASNLLYASREIAGGFTTSLNSSASLFEDAAKIALTSRVGDVSDISGVLTSVAAIVGATAPDLADAIVDTVVQAATGGNSSQITALRSLSGVGASNTAFLQAFASDPKQIFEDLFRNLSDLQNMSSSNYMEVAEALSDTFGMSIDAFARVDFDYLADAIEAMDLDSNAMYENLALVASGQTASTDAQLRMQKINETMVEEGLAYVLDNEVARSIQEHMWDEQIAQQMMENQFSVDIVGGALDLFNGIATTISMIGDILNPIQWIKKIGEVTLKAVEATTLGQDVVDVLTASKVGSGNAEEFSRLTTTGVEFTELATRKSYLTDLLNLKGMTSAGEGARQGLNLLDSIYNSMSAVNVLRTSANNLVGAINGAGELVNQAYNSGREQSVLDIANIAVRGDMSSLTGKEAIAQSPGTSGASYSFYTTKLISKSESSAGMRMGDWKEAQHYNALYDNFEQSSTSDDTRLRTSDEAEELRRAITDSMTTAVNNIAESSKSLISATKTVGGAGYNIDSLTQVERKALVKALENSENLDIQHRAFYTQQELLNQVLTEQIQGTGQSFEDWVKEFEISQGQEPGWLSSELSLYSSTLNDLEQIYNQQQATKANAETKARELHEVQFWEDMQQFATKDFPWYMREWERYYIQHQAYTEATAQGDNSKSAYEVAMEIADVNTRQTGDSVLALAEALTQNSMWQKEQTDALKDPVLHTNVLLAKILLVVEAIMQQNNETSIVSVPTALSSLGLGVSNT